MSVWDNVESSGDERRKQAEIWSGSWTTTRSRAQILAKEYEEEAKFHCPGCSYSTDDEWDLYQHIPGPAIKQDDGTGQAGGQEQEGADSELEHHLSPSCGDEDGPVEERVGAARGAGGSGGSGCEGGINYLWRWEEEGEVPELRVRGDLACDPLLHDLHEGPARREPRAKVRPGLSMVDGPGNRTPPTIASPTWGNPAGSAGFSGAESGRLSGAASGGHHAGRWADP